MDIAELEAFLATADRKSVTGAARELGMTQPALSRQIQKLERQVGMPLLIRSWAGVALTPAGERLRAYAEDVRARHRQLLEEIKGVEAALEGELRIAASTTPAEFLVPRLLAEFTAANPNVQAIVFTTDSQGVVDELVEGRRDLGFVGAVIHRRGLRFDPIMQDEVVLAVPRRHPFAQQRQVPIEALAHERFIEREDGSGTVLSVRRALSERGLELPPYRVVMQLSTTQAIVSAVRAGYGIGFVSSLALEQRSSAGPARVRLAGLPLRRCIYLVRHERHLPPPAGRRFVEFLLQRVPVLQCSAAFSRAVGRASADHVVGPSATAPAGQM
ncbi:MAG: LysR family transcriptional regulator [Chloroflexi bacterium]|nr:LysR family transcriptional regulator [Chloroflexota bacterium]